jgi:hypothetical protein
VTDLASLVVKLTAQTAEYEKKLDQANVKLTRFQKQTDSQLKGIQRSFAAFNKTLGAIGVGVSFVAVTRGLAGMAREAIEFGDEMEKASLRTGVGAGTFSELAGAAKLADVQVGTLSKGMRNLLINVSEASSGSKSAIATFGALGLKVEEIANIPADKQLEVIAERLTSLKDPADRARAGSELFGKAWEELAPFMLNGAAGIRAAREEITKLGGALTDEQIRQLADADEAVKKLDAAWTGLARTLTVAAAPALTATFQAIQNGVTWLSGGEAKVLSFAEAWDALGRAVDKNGFGTTWFDFMREAQAGGPQVNQKFSTGTRMPPGGRNRAPFVPGYVAPTPPAGRGAGGVPPDPAVLAGLEQISVTAREISVGAVEQLYRDWDSATQTAMQKALAEWEDFDRKVAELAAAGRITPEDAAARIQENTANYLEPITITAEKIFPEQEREQLSEFWLQASRNTQDILAEFIFDPFSQGLDDWAEDFGRMLQRMAAEAIAADIAGKIFGTGGMGSGGGWLGQLAGFAGSLLGGMGGGKLTPITVTAQRIPGYADGGFLRPGQIGMVGERGPELAFGGRHGMTIEPNGARSGVVVQNHFTIQAPAGSVSRATEMQIAAAAARGAARANQRNN